MRIVGIGRYCQPPAGTRTSPLLSAVWDKTEVYCQEALSYPLPDTDASSMYFMWAASLRARYAYWRGPRWAVGRRRVADVALRGLRFTLDHGAPRDTVVLPGVDKMDVVGPSEKDIQRHEAQVAARRAAERLSDLQATRTALSQLCARVYAVPPAAPEELRTRAAAALEGYPEAVQDIMDMLDADLKRRRGE